MPETALSTRQPTEREIDVFGLTHPGKIRTENQDQFLIASLHTSLAVHGASLDTALLGDLTSTSRGYVLLVADGVGSGQGREASETALRAIVSHVMRGVNLCTRPSDDDEERRYLEELRTSITRSHAAVRDAAERAGGAAMATTLTMAVVRWPVGYVLHVGDSRCYRLRHGALERLTHDQTLAQAMVDQGVLSPESAEKSHLRHVLYSAVGGQEFVLHTHRTDCDRRDVLLLCSDGLTKHVADEEIAEVLLTPESSETSCRRLLQMALDRGGSDNITVVVGRLRP